MSEVWNENSIIENRKSFIATPQISQLSASAGLREFIIALTKMYKNEIIDDTDFLSIIWFLNSEYKNTDKERYDLLVKYATLDFKRKYTVYILKQNKVNDSIIKAYMNNNLASVGLDNIYKMMRDNNSKFLLDPFIDDNFKNAVNSLLTSDYIKDRESISLIGNNGLKDIKLMNKELKFSILSSIPNEYSDLKKCIYVYIKLCQMFSYDEFYYVNAEMAKSLHSDLNHIKNIDEKNSSLICYEFVTLYQELLQELGITIENKTNFAMDVDDNDKAYVTEFMDGHANLLFEADGISVFADSTTSVLNGDLINSKLGNKLNGLKCQSADLEVIELFNNSVNEVYDSLKNHDINDYKDISFDTSFNDRLKALFNDLNKLDMQSIDLISYITNIKYKLFTKDELKWNLSINYVGKNNGDSAYPVIVFSVNTNDIKNVVQDTVHYIFDPKTHQIVKYENNELRELIGTELFMFEEGRGIPGVGGGPRR